MMQSDQGLISCFQSEQGLVKNEVDMGIYEGFHREVFGSNF